MFSVPRTLCFLRGDTRQHFGSFVRAVWCVGIQASAMAMSADNIRGFALALSSSVFIGSSFIVKKIGLKKAGMYGVRAGSASFSIFHH